jgi:hypothetical protein
LTHNVSDGAAGNHLSFTLFGLCSLKTFVIDTVRIPRFLGTIWATTEVLNDEKNDLDRALYHFLTHGISITKLVLKNWPGFLNRSLMAAGCAGKITHFELNNCPYLCTEDLEPLCFSQAKTTSLLLYGPCNVKDTPEFLRMFLELPHLRALKFKNVAIPRSFSSELTVLHLSDCAMLDDEIVNQICVDCSNLENFFIDANPQLSSQSLVKLYRLKALRVLNLASCHGIRILAGVQHCKKLTRLDISRNFHVGLTQLLSCIVMLPLLNVLRCCSPNFVLPLDTLNHLPARPQPLLLYCWAVLGRTPTSRMWNNIFPEFHYFHNITEVLESELVSA